MRLENAEIGQWEMKLNSDLTAKVELTIRADIVVDPKMQSFTFASPMVRRDFEHYISTYEYGDGLVGGEKTKSELFEELCELRKEVSDATCEKASLEMIVKDLEEGLKANLEEQKEWRHRFLNMRNTLGSFIDSEYGGYLPDDKIISHFSNLAKSFKDLTDKKYELSKELDSEKKSLIKSTVEQNLRAENVRLKAENEKHKTRISELEESLDCIHCESAAALGYECE